MWTARSWAHERVKKRKGRVCLTGFNFPLLSAICDGSSLHALYLCGFETLCVCVVYGMWKRGGLYVVIKKKQNY